MNMEKWKILPAGDFTYYKKDWNQLNERGPNSPLLHAEFVNAALEQLTCKKVHLAYMISGQEIKAMTLIIQRRLGVWETFQPSQLPIGPWVSAKNDFHDYLQLLARDLPGSVLLLSLTQIDPVHHPRPKHTKHLVTLDYIETARVNIASSSFEEYWNSRGRNIRRTIARQHNALARQNVVHELQSLHHANDVEQAIQDYSGLEVKGWKGNCGTAIRSEEKQGFFYRQVLTDFCRRGMGRIYRYWYNDRLVACDLCILQGSTLVVLKTAYDESVTASSPAMLLRYAYFREIFSHESDISTIEFYGRTMDWHRKLTEDIRWLYHINYFPLPILKTLNQWRR